MEISVQSSLSDISPDQWNACVSQNNAFLEHEFLFALEQSGCVGNGKPWQPHFILCKDKGTLVGAVPAYLKTDSFGEFIFDWQWASMYENSGLDYYPKLTVAVPFTPATGERLLIHPKHSLETIGPKLVQALIQQGKELNVSSIHFLYLSKSEQHFLEGQNFHSRLSFEFFWKNQNFRHFDDYLLSLNSNRRKSVKKEHKKANSNEFTYDVVTGETITEQHIELMFQFYKTIHSQKGSPIYLNLEFFQHLHQHFSHRLLLVLAKKDDRYVAGSFNLYKNNRLFGRYWGCSEQLPNLHFECCFYRLIDFAIRHKIDTVEAGAQGEQKFLRGFDATETYSSHYFYHPQAKSIFSNFLRDEEAYIKNVIKGYNQKSAIKS